ncbi:MAG: hypothetical protein JNK77_01375 [Saprospiraceae bacterium]|nr:hypothetical protein [Saprospiraceae bacterium]
MWYGTIGPRNKYQYNGKELNEDFGLHWYDFGARWQDPAAGRWWVGDALAELPHNNPLTPYHYVADNPVNNIDPDGLDWYRGQDGKAVWFDRADDTFTDDNGNAYNRIGEYYIMEGKNGFLIHHQNEVIAQVENVSAGIAGQGIDGKDLLHAGDFYFSKQELFDWGVGNQDVSNWILSSAPLALQKEYFSYARSQDLREAAGPVALAIGAPVALIVGAELAVGASAVNIVRYPRAKGFGIDFGTFRIDWHRIRLGGRKTGKDYNLPHIDIPGKVKHWPWHQLKKWRRGVK